MSRMSLMTPSEHAARGWVLGAYQDGKCVALLAERRNGAEAQFRELHEPEGCEVIDLALLKAEKAS